MTFKTMCFQETEHLSLLVGGIKYTNQVTLTELDGMKTRCYNIKTEIELFTEEQEAMAEMLLEQEVTSLLLTIFIYLSTSFTAYSKEF